MNHGRVIFLDAPSMPQVQVEIATTLEQQTQGLMYRTNLAPNAGMLFSWGHEGPRVLWMRNTYIPLDMIFITKDGRIAGILENVPALSNDTRSVPNWTSHVLEVNAGWTRAHGVQVGQRVQIS